MLLSILSLVALAALFVFLAVRSRDNPLFLAGGVAFLALGRSAFIDIIPDEVLRQLAWLSVTTGDVLFFLLALGWFYAYQRRRAPRVRLSLKWWMLGVFMACFLALEIALTSASERAFHVTQLLITRDWFYIPLGYLLILDILRRFTVDETAKYVKALCLLSVGLLMLYIVSALNVPVYPYPKYLTTTFGGTTIVRDFTTIPLWLGLAWGLYLATTRKNRWTLVALVLLACGGILTYTRSIVLALVVTAVLATVLLMVRRGRHGRAVATSVGGVVVILAVFVGGPIVASAQYGYFQSRFAGISRPRDVLNDPNVSFRQTLLREAYGAGAAVDPLFGAGLFDPSPTGLAQRYRSYDSDWIRIAYRTGPAGIVVFATPLLLGFWWGVRSFLRQGPSRPTDALLLAGVLAAAYSSMLQFSGLMYFWWPMLSLFPVALIAYATGVPTAVSIPASGPPRLLVGPSWLRGGP